MSYRIDLNCDLGESFGHYHLGNDQQVLQYVTSANIACGFHGGDPSVMKRTVAICVENGVAIGVHPGLPDLVGFGRRTMSVSADEVHDMVVYQIGALLGFALAEGAVLHHVKPHGALYNMAAKDRTVADAIARAVQDVDRNLVLFGLSGSQLIEAGKAAGLTTASEVFADRTYQPDGSLTPRDQAGALITDVSEAVTQVLKMVKEQTVRTVGGGEIQIVADTVCLHGDGAHAMELAQMLRQTLTAEGIQCLAG
ncbi:LamB/YcsF family protein [Alicyclobacillus ferrooxydans]|uniref:5-oxoprolinase subunit A n=1 Tax=Alicyclobacillus ferrooxydans TaxID=471514 RepID=A0A0P9CIU7_9BACL|nr:5-oxoprolinase subunit PxpA [Alicyclobacillus ferrooxydans]KPV45551.1 lactam utilization protein LamB [Alicyclobacillus ferrooxydans]